MNRIDEMDMQIKRYLKLGYQKFVLYPFGEFGLKAKEILNKDYNIKEIICLDENKEGIKSLEYLKEFPLKEDEYVLITSWNPHVYDAVRKSIREYVPQNQILDLFPKAWNPSKEEYLESIAVKSGMDIENNMFQLQKYNVKFYIPHWKTDYIQKRILCEGNYYDDESLFMIRKNWGKCIANRTVLDIGANIGNHSLYFALECGAKKIHAFEPIKDTFDVLEKNIDVNGLRDVVKLYNVGVGEHQCKASIGSYSIENTGATRLVNDESGEVEICAIDDLYLNEDIGFIKIDVEGFEVQVVRGALKTIERNRPCIMMESWDERILDIIECLTSLGYSYIQYNPSNYIFYIEENVYG